MPVPTLNTDIAHAHTVGEEKELKHWFQYKTPKQNQIIHIISIVLTEYQMIPEKHPQPANPAN